MDDLEQNPAYLEPIKQYMIDRKGKHYATKSAEDIVDDFTRHMRFFNTNEAVTLSEALYMHKADDDKKARAGEAYKVYDRLGNVFVNDGIYGAIDGVSDYIQSIMSSPSTYIGFGVAKGVNMLAGKGFGAAVRKQAMQAYKNKIGQGKDVARKAFDDVMKKGVHKQRVATATGTGIIDAGIAVDQDIRLQKTELKAGSRDVYDPLQTTLSGVASAGGTALAIKTLPKVKARSDSAGVTRKVKEAARKTREGIRVTEEQKRNLAEELKKNAEKSFGKKQGGDIFRREAAKGEKIFVKDALEREADDLAGPAIVELDANGEVFIQKPKQPKRLYEGNLVQKIIGNKKDGTYILDAAERAGISLPFSMTKGDKIATVLNSLDPQGAKDFRNIIYENTGLYLGSIHDNLAPNIAATVSRSIQNAAETLVATQGKKLQRDAAYVQGSIYQKLADETALSRDFVEETVDSLTEADRKGSPLSLGYAQNLWKRMLVSAPQTTAVNIFGWGQWYTANTIAEVLQGGLYFSLGTLKGANLTEAGKRDLALSKAMFQLQKEKFRNFADPYATYRSYMELLNTDPKLKRRLFDTFSGGVERTAKRFDINEANALLKLTEGIADAAGTISGVRLQDSVTKSQVFMTSIDKQLRLQKNITFSEVLEKGDFSDLSDDVMDKALEDTMKSVFSFDYTKQVDVESTGNIFRDKIAQAFDAPGTAGRALAKYVETASSNPFIGFILPFGRFMNNVVAYSYTWGPTGIFPAMAAIAKGKKIDFVESFSRATVGTTALIMAYDFQKEQARKGYAYNEMETGGGDVIDIGNTFPLSLLMAGGRFIHDYFEGGDLKDIREELLKQIAIGQTASDLSFGNDLTKLISQVELAFQGDTSGKDLTNPDSYWEFLFNKGTGTLLGNIGSGYTRFLDPVNRIMGYMTDTDPGIDRRLADGFGGALSLNGLKYTDNIFEGLRRFVTGDEDYLLGEKAQVAYREGDIYDPSPIQTMMGVRVQQPRTAVDIMFGMVGKPKWRSSMYTGIPEHDNYVNRVITPLMERTAERLLKKKGFRDAPLKDKQRMVQQVILDTRTLIRDNLTRLPKQMDSALNYEKVKIDRGNSAKSIKDARMHLGIKNNLRDMDMNEVGIMNNYLGLEPDYVPYGIPKPVKK